MTDQTYTLNCDQCGGVYQSIEAFPGAQLCGNCTIRAKAINEVFEEIEKNYQLPDTHQSEPYRGLVAISKEQWEALKQRLLGGEKMKYKLKEITTITPEPIVELPDGAIIIKAEFSTTSVSHAEDYRVWVIDYLEPLKEGG